MSEQETVSVRHWEHLALIDMPDFLRELEDIQWRSGEWTAVDQRIDT